MITSRKLLGLLVVLVLALRPAAAQFCPLSADESVSRIVSCKPAVSMDECRSLAQTAGCNVVRDLPSINAVVITIPKARLGINEARLRNRKQIDRVDADERVNWLKAEALPAFGPLTFTAFAKAKAPAPAPNIPWGVARVNAPAAWSVTRGAGIKVAIIDTGVDPSHPDLSANVAGGFNAVDSSKPGDFADDQGHGTHVAGTIAGLGLNGGVVGVAPQARLYAVKVLDRFGNGSFSEIIAGLDWAVQNRMDVANMSLGADEGSEPLLREVQAATKAGLVIVAAAGNANGGPMSFPGAYPETISVSASDAQDRFAPYSSKGAGVSFIAPGTAVLSTIPGGKYGENTGTSMAAPHVTGLAALAMSLGARGTEGVRSALQGAARKLPELSADQQGAGMIDAGVLVGRAAVAAQ